LWQALALSIELLQLIPLPLPAAWTQRRHCGKAGEAQRKALR